MTIENPRNLTPDELEREHWILGNRIQAEVYGTVSDLEAELNGVEKIASDTQENIQRALSNIDEALNELPIVSSQSLDEVRRWRDQANDAVTSDAFNFIVNDLRMIRDQLALVTKYLAVAKSALE